jgi:hypothetical protein
MESRGHEHVFVFRIDLITGELLLAGIGRSGLSSRMSGSRITNRHASGAVGIVLEATLSAKRTTSSQWRAQRSA